ncbi:thiol:disulfide interchange protein DsbA/DsbL [Viridibacterium curvum]|uniref:Thiol:disulfide interchange protein n=1 Tax=Viridibacterium curvum TaxID=1101404 RepID=A0ABP9QLU3_9RHOO
MFRRTLMKAAFAATLLGLAGISQAATVGKDYELLSPAQPGGTNGQIEVVEFFSFGCPHCANLEPKLEKWRAEQAKDVVLVRVPVIFRKEWQPLARMHYTLEAMGLSDKLSGAVFDAIHKNYVRMDDEAKRNEWLAKQGVDVKKFNDTWRSFGIDAQMRRATQMAEKYKIQSVPALYVDGQYFVRNKDEKMPEDQTHTKNLATATELINMVRASKSKK